MKNIVYLLIGMFIFSSCEDVVDLDLNNAAPRLVIDASIELNASSTTTTLVELTRTAGFYDEDPIFVNDATVTITLEDGTIVPVPFVENGQYRTGFPFIFAVDPMDSMNYTLTVEDQGNIYTATESIERTVPITDVEQEMIDGFGDDITKITGFFNDPAGLGDNYLFEYEDEFNTEVDIADDEFIDGNRAPTVFFMEDLPAGTLVTLRIKGIDQRCYSFYETLLQQTDSDGGGPFATQPSVVRGNIVNTTNPDLYPFGYFRISEVFEIEYTVQENN
jgi:hypothetical protein